MELSLLGVWCKWKYPQLRMSNDDVQGPLPTSMLEALEVVEQCSCGAIGDVYIIYIIYLAEMH